MILLYNGSTLPIRKTILGATTPGQSGSESDSNEGVLNIPQGSSITGTSPPDCLMSYPGNSLGGDLIPRKRCNRFIAPADWALYNGDKVQVTKVV